MNSVFTIPAPSFTNLQIEQILKSHFGISGHVKNLYGDRDQNLLIKTKKLHYILKVFNVHEKKEIIDFQDIAINYIRKNDSEILVPLTLDQKRIRQNGKTYTFKLLKYLEGKFLYEEAMSSHDYTKMGFFMGRLSTALIGFNHKAAYRLFEWDCRRIDIIKTNLNFIKNQTEKDTILFFLNQYTENVVPFLHKLRMSVIHNDGNDHNILINHKHKTFGIIDFGDMIHSFHIIEPAVAIAYIYLDNRNPFENVYAFLKGYHTVFPLETIELKLILYFMCMRLCTTVTMSAWRKKLFPSNKYLRISEKPAWTALNALSKKNLSQLSNDLLKNVG